MTTIEQSTGILPSRSAPTAPKAVIASDFETFLKMLTTQLKNQDPLNPIESSDFAVQLATFSSVEQQVMTNDLLTGLSTQMGMAQLAGWVGMEARGPFPVKFDGFPVEVHPKAMPTSDNATLVVRNQEGAIVQSLQIPITGEPYTWTGRDGFGQSFPVGTYSFVFEGYKNDVLEESHVPESFERIREARIDNGNTVLVMEGGSVVASNLVSGLRN
jgi:flagellar basal-body rod modification protein FlgD